MQPDLLVERLAALQDEVDRRCAASRQLVAESQQVCHMIRLSSNEAQVTVDRTRHLLAQTWLWLTSLR